MPLPASAVPDLGHRLSRAHLAGLYDGPLVDGPDVALRLMPDSPPEIGDDGPPRRLASRARLLWNAEAETGESGDAVALVAGDRIAVSSEAMGDGPWELVAPTRMLGNAFAIGYDSVVVRVGDLWPQTATLSSIDEGEIAADLETAVWPIGDERATGHGVAQDYAGETPFANLSLLVGPNLRWTVDGATYSVVSVTPHRRAPHVALGLRRAG